MADSIESEGFDGPLLGEAYRLGPLIGKGGQGSTYLAYDRAHQRRVAVKAFLLGKASGWKDFDLFERECQVLRKLAHPRIPKYLDEVKSDDGATYYLVMEHVSGETLRAKLQREGALSEAALWQVLWQLVDVLDYLHSQSPPVVHRDIKPLNLIERPDGELALVDFGGVRTVLRGDGGSTVVGTFGYMAPEQLHGAATPATDLFALGATLVALGTGMEPEHLPRQGLRMDFSQHLQVSPQLQRLLGRLTEPEPGARPRSGTALKLELEQGLDDEEFPVEESGAEPEGPPLFPGMPPKLQQLLRTLQDLEPRAPKAPGRPRAPGAGPQLPDDVPPQVGIALGVLMTVVGTLGTVAVAVLDAAIVPLIFALIAIFAGTQKKQLAGQKQKVHLALKDAETSLKEMSRSGVKDFEAHRARLPEDTRRRRQLRKGHKQRRLPRR